MANEIDPKEGLTLRDVQGMLKPGTIERTVVDEIHAHDDLLQDVKFFPASKGDRDEADVVMSKPKAHHTMLGEGKVASGYAVQTKSVAPARAYAMLEILTERYNELKKVGKAEQFLAKEIRAQVSSLQELLVMDILYGDRKVDAKGFNGLAAFYNTIGNTSGSDLSYSTRTLTGMGSLSTATADNVSDLRSIFAVTFSEDKVKMFYPDYAQNIGLDFGDKMKDVQKTDPKNGGIVWWMQREFNWTCGLHIVNPTGAGRLANIPKNKMLTTSNYAEEVLLPQLITLTDMVKAGPGEKTFLYMDPKLWTNIKILLAKVKWQNAYSDEQIDSLHKRTLFGKEVRLNESQGFAEDLVA